MLFDMNKVEIVPKLAANDFAHPAVPGSGPKNKRCKDCLHCCKCDNGYGYITKKCWLMNDYWKKQGVRTTIKANDLACAKYVESEE